MYKQISVNEETYNLLKYYKNTGAIASMSGYLSRLIENDKWRFFKDFDPFANEDIRNLFVDEDISSNITSFIAKSSYDINKSLSRSILLYIKLTIISL